MKKLKVFIGDKEVGELGYDKIVLPNTHKTTKQWDEFIEKNAIEWSIGISNMLSEEDLHCNCCSTKMDKLPNRTNEFYCPNKDCPYYNRLRGV